MGQREGDVTDVLVTPVIEPQHAQPTASSASKGEGPSK